MYSILTTVFLYLSYFVCLQLLLKFIQKKKKNNWINFSVSKLAERR